MRVIRRFLGSLMMIFVVVSLTFFLIRLMPGNPLEIAYEGLLQTGVSPQQAAIQIHIMYNVFPNSPVFIQYVQYIWQVLHGNLGVSIAETGRPVLGLILASAPWTLLLVSIGLLISFAIGLILGVWTALRRDTWVDHLVSQTSSIFHGVPNYVTGFALLYIFTVLLPWFPFGGIYSASMKPAFTLPFIASVAYHAVLPVTAYVLSGFGSWMLTAKSAAVGVLGDDFMMASRVRGLTPDQQLSHLVRNSVLPLFTGFVLSVGFMFGGAVFIETMFTIPGLGYLISTAVSQKDYPVMEGTFLILTAAVILANFLADVLYSRIDPRIRT